MFEAVFFFVSALVFVHLAATVVSAAVFLHARGEPLFPTVPPVHRSPWVELLGSLGREVGARTLLALLWPFGLPPERLTDGDAFDRSRPPVVLVHGYGHNRAALWPLSWWLERKGWTTFTFSHQAVETIEVKARRLAGRVEVVRQLAGAQRVDIVAHSMGGIIARYFIEQLGGAASVGRLITLGTPHKGTGMAIFARGEAASQLLPGSEVVTALARSLDAGREVKYTAIAGDMDTLVFPLDAALLGPPHDDVVLEGLGHNTLLTHGAAFNAVRSALLQGAPAGPARTVAPPLLESA